MSDSFPMHVRAAVARLADVAEPLTCDTCPNATFTGTRVTLTMTTCKRFDLFKRTVASLMRSVADLEQHVCEMVVVDDGSSDVDRAAMQAFLTRVKPVRFVWKTPAQKGHARSMNLLVSSVRTPYMLHVEDDWEFHMSSECYPLVTFMLDVLEHEPDAAQVLFNTNYSETYDNYVYGGGEYRMTAARTAYVMHEYHNRPVAGPNCAYWPHFSLRPGLWDLRRMRERLRLHVRDPKTLAGVDTTREPVVFDPVAAHFEMEFAKTYTAAGLVTCFLPGMCTRHIGKLTCDTAGINAYVLNGEPQFFRTTNPKANPLDAYQWVYVNLARRRDRNARFRQATTGISTPIARLEALDGKKHTLSWQDVWLFRPGDYNYHAGIVGCALSHLRLWVALVNGAYGRDTPGLVVFEDDYVPPNNGAEFEEMVAGLLARDTEFDVAFVHTHVRPGAIRSVPGCTGTPEPLEWVDVGTSVQSFALSYGGTGCYIITLTGALKLLEHINRMGMTNAIDTVMQLAADSGVRLRYALPPYGYAPLCTSVHQDSDVQQDSHYLVPPGPAIETGETGGLLFMTAGDVRMPFLVS